MEDSQVWMRSVLVKVSLVIIGVTGYNYAITTAITNEKDYNDRTGRVYA